MWFRVGALTPGEGPSPQGRGRLDLTDKESWNKSNIDALQELGLTISDSSNVEAGLACWTKEEGIPNKKRMIIKCNWPAGAGDGLVRERNGRAAVLEMILFPKRAIAV